LFVLSKLSLANRAVVALITVIIAAFGFLSLGSLKQELIPSIEIPSAAIVTSYAGASPEVVDDQVSVPIENAVLGLENLESTTVTSTTGLSVIRVSFEYGTTAAQATERLNNAISKVQASLPEGAEPQVLSGSFDSVPIIILAVSANDGDNEAIGRQLEQSAPSIFQQVDGVRDVAVSGAVSKQLNLTLNQFRLASVGLTQRDIATALTANGLVLPVGTLTDEKGSIAIQMGSAVSTVEAIEALPLVGGSSSSVVTIGDVADVVYEDSPITSIARTNGNASLAVAITKTPDANTVAVSKGVQELVPDLEAALGNDVTIVTTLDQAPFIQKSIKDLTTEGLLGLTFAVIIILIFLFSVKSTIITAISIPTSVLITFIGLQTADYSLNILTLGALTIAIGRVVDDSIVVIENINRHLSYGEKRKKAVLTAVKEVSGAITASTITTVAVFLPIALVGGLIGELFRPFAFTVAISLLASLLVSLTIVPVLAYWFLRMPKRLVALKEADPKHFEKKQRHAEEEREKKSFLQRAYLPALNGTRRHPWLTLFASILILGFTFSLVPQLKTNFIDGAGSTQFITRLSMPASTTFEDQDKASSELEQKIMEIDGVTVVQATVGSAADGRVAFGAAASGISITVQVDEKVDVETVKSEVLALEVPADSELTVASGAGFGSSETIDIEVSSSDNELLQEAVDILTTEMESVPNTSGVTSTLDADERVLEIIVDREKAAAIGFTETQVTGIVASQLRPSPLGRVSIDGDDVSVFVAGTDLPESIEEIKALVIPSFTGLVRLDSIASVEEVLKPTSITSKEGNRTAKVSIAPEGDDLGAITLDITTKLDEVELPAGVTATIGGAAADQAESFQQLGLALLAAIAIVYIVMVATFGSLIQPLLLLVSIPFAATGALGLLLLTDTPLGVPALIGMLMLIGIVVTNAIVLIDLVNQYRKEGRSVEDSLVSGARQRLRPILMTALATIFALTPMAMGLTGNSGFISQPLAIVVIGGLFSSTLLTLILVPTLYWLVEGRKERKAIRIARREAAASKKAEKAQAKADGKAAATAPVIAEPAAPAPAAVVETLQAYQAPKVIEAPEVVEEVTEDALADAIAETFTPAQPAETPNLSWSISQDEVELDSEATMQWSESKTETAPIAAVQQPEESLDFLTRENPIVTEPSKKELKAQRKAEKAELKAQKKAAKNSRHSGD
jgi:HAE1 family hydrophobic/amphiphilic exporter-1